MAKKTILISIIVWLISVISGTPAVFRYDTIIIDIEKELLTIDDEMLDKDLLNDAGRVP